MAVKEDSYNKRLYYDSNELLCELRFGNVCYHRDLLKKDEVCLGGGSYSIKHDDGVDLVVMSEVSSDFGRPCWTSKLITRIVTEHSLEGYKFIHIWDWKWKQLTGEETIELTEKIETVL